MYMQQQGGSTYRCESQQFQTHTHTDQIHTDKHLQYHYNKKPEKIEHYRCIKTSMRLSTCTEYHNNNNDNK